MNKESVAEYFRKKFKEKKMKKIDKKIAEEKKFAGLFTVLAAIAGIYFFITDDISILVEAIGCLILVFILVAEINILEVIKEVKENEGEDR